MAATLKALIRPRDDGPRGRALVGVFLATGILHVLAAVYNLIYVHTRWRYYYTYNYSGSYHSRYHDGTAAGYIVFMIIQGLTGILLASL
ncbi:hypothetical protein Micbo1qcDRAFT_161550, partial [Microdochium bolleyi]